MKLKGKITAGALIMLVTVTFFSILTVSVIVYRQNREASADILKKSFRFISGEIDSYRKQLLDYSLQMATTGDMGNNLRYVGEGT